MKINDNQKKIISLLVAGLVWGAVPEVSAAPLVTMKQMVQKVIESNPEVQSKYHAFTAAGYDQEAVRGGYFPKLDLTSTIRSQEDLPGQSIIDANGTAIPSNQTDLVLHQMIFDGFATPSEVSRYGYAKRVRYYELQSAMDSTSLDFSKAYLDILRYRELTEFAKSNYIIHKQLFDRIKERADAGVARRVDLDQAQGRLALAEANLLTETTNLHDVNVRMQRILGELPPDTLEKPEFDKLPLDPSVSDALKVAYVNNPQILSTIEDIQATKEEVNAKKGKYYPRLDLQARKNLDSSNDGRNSSNAADLLELTMNFNLFNGFTDKSNVSAEVERLNGANDVRDRACVDTRQLVNIAYNDISQLKEQLEYRDRHQKSIELAREAYRKQFDIGQRTLLDLLDTENEYFQAKRAYTNTDYDMQTAYARLYSSQGQLLNKLGIARTNLPELNREAYQDAANVCQAIAPDQIKIDKASLVDNAAPLSIGDKQLIKPQATASCTDEAITSRVNDWATAWRQKDYDGYMKFYSDKFTPEPPLTMDTWRQQRNVRLTTYAKINLAISNIKVSCEGDKATATFDQDYSMTTYKLLKPKQELGCAACAAKRVATTGYKDNVNKTLNFEKNGSDWKILRELVNNKRQ